MKAAYAAALVLMGLGQVACTPEWARDGESPMVLLMTGINSGTPLDSDIQISNGATCPDFAILRVENHFKNPSIQATGFRGDIVIERYEVRYFRSDGRNQEGVDVPFRISGNVAQEIIAPGAATLALEVVRRQAKLEPPLRNLRNQRGAVGGPLVVTVFAEVTIHARSTIRQTTNAATARLQIDFADFADTDTECPAPPTT